MIEEIRKNLLDNVIVPSIVTLVLIGVSALYLYFQVL